MAKTLTTKIYLRNDTSTNWRSNNPILGKGEMGIETDTNKFKFGDGSTRWNSLDYSVADGGDINVIEIVKVNGTALTPDRNKAVDITVPQGTVTSVQVQATSPVQSSTSTAQSTTLSTTISLADGYGDTKNPYASKTKNYVLAAPSNQNGAPGFRRLVKGDLPALTASDVGALPSSTTIPTKVSDLTNDSGFQTRSDVQGLIDTAVSSAFTYKGTKATVSRLPSTGNKVGDVWHVTADDSEYAWDGSAWEELGGVVDLSGYYTSTQVDTLLLGYIQTTDELILDCGTSSTNLTSSN